MVLDSSDFRPALSPLNPVLFLACLPWRQKLLLVWVIYHIQSVTRVPSVSTWPTLECRYHVSGRGDTGDQHRERAARAGALAPRSCAQAGRDRRGLALPGVAAAENPRPV